MAPATATRWRGFVPTLATNRIKSFLHSWYAAFDASPEDPAEVLRYLTDDELFVAFPGREMHTRAEFREFYVAARRGLLHSAHHVHGIQITRGSDGTYEATIEVLYQRVREAEGVLSDLASVQVSLVERHGSFLIRRYRAVLVGSEQ